MTILVPYFEQIWNGFQYVKNYLKYVRPKTFLVIQLTEVGLVLWLTFSVQNTWHLEFLIPTISAGLTACCCFYN